MKAVRLARLLLALLVACVSVMPAGAAEPARVGAYDFIKKGGWVTVAGVERPIDGAAELCAKNLLDATLPAPAKTSG